MRHFAPFNRFALFAATALLLAQACQPTAENCNCPCPPKEESYTNAYVQELVKTNHLLSKAEGDAFIAKFNQYRIRDTSRKEQTGGVAEGMPTAINLPAGTPVPLSESFNNRSMCLLLGLAGSVGVRTYYGINGEGRVVILLSGIDAEGKPLFIKQENKQTATAASGGLNDVKLMQPGGRQGVAGEEYYLEMGRIP
ncbi:MAG TPA: hypothetical protein PKD90_17410 [Phnomibacter sp.]|nr:hypothetical protein [Phnomibacter sp.]